MMTSELVTVTSFDDKANPPRYRTYRYTAVTGDPCEFLNTPAKPARPRAQPSASSKKASHAPR